MEQKWWLIPRKSNLSYKRKYCSAKLTMIKGITLTLLSFGSLIRRNADRKLTPGQRRAKKIRKFQEDTTYSTKVLVFKVLSPYSFFIPHLQAPKLTPLNKRKIELNANQYYLTGCCVQGPTFTYGSFILFASHLSNLTDLFALKAVLLDFVDTKNWCWSESSGILVLVISFPSFTHIRCQWEWRWKRFWWRWHRRYWHKGTACCLCLGGDFPFSEPLVPMLTSSRARHWKRHFQISEWRVFEPQRWPKNISRIVVLAITLCVSLNLNCHFYELGPLQELQGSHGLSGSSCDI